MATCVIYQHIKQHVVLNKYNEKLESTNDHTAIQ